MSQNGKGDSPRKKGVSEDVWARNWERIFGKKGETKGKPKK
jgi:hypothetical protein